MKVTQKSLLSSLHQTLEKHKIIECEKGNTNRTEVITSIKKEFESWCPDGSLHSIGSYRLGVHCPDSDIDLVCVSPKRLTREDFQHVFFSRLENLIDVSYCFGIFTAKVPIIKLIMKGIKVDLQFASTDQDLKTFDYLNIAELDEASLLGINAIRNNEFILNAVPDVDSFRFLARAVKLWAKQKNLYSGVGGGLGGISWNILCAKICIRYAGLSVVELIEKFFKVFSQWDWTVPVSILNAEDCFGFSGRENLMNIMTPVHPSYNTAYTLISSGFSCIFNELETACKIVKDVVEGNMNWDALFEELDFFQQNRYFVRISINANDENDFETWSGLVFSRVKYLLQEIERVYPRPVVNLLNKPFQGYCKQFKNCCNYFVGLRFMFTQCVKLDLRVPIHNFCTVLNEIRPDKGSMNLRVAFVTRKDFLNVHGKQALKS
jgi:poly(A) polymerase